MTDKKIHPATLDLLRECATRFYVQLVRAREETGQDDELGVQCALDDAAHLVDGMRERGWLEWER
jgi:hypothetical protein